MGEIVGYTALTVSLFSMTMTSMKRFRWLHLSSSILYLGYGILIQAYPVIIGAILFALIHLYRLIKMEKE